MRPAGLSVCIVGAALIGCGSGAGPPPAAAPSASRFIHTPPIGTLDPTRLRTLSMDCEKYPPGAVSRGPYDLAYCENAMAAWGDSPLQMVTIPENVVTPQTVTPHPSDGRSDGQPDNPRQPQ
jgi:hypothetical protein